MTQIIQAVQHNELVDKDQVCTHLVWAIQVQYISGRALPSPSPGIYSAVVLAEIVPQRRQTSNRPAERTS
jgi:hypothetical protein